MADLYKVPYISKRGQATKVAIVSATSEANAVAAAKAADVDFSQHVTASVIQHNIIVGS